MLKGKTVILGVTGSIAAYKIADLASKLSKLHCNVHVIMTKNATNFINPITFEEKIYFGVLYFLSTKQVVTYSTDNHDYSVNESYDKADTLMLDLKYPNFSVRRDVWDERALGKFLDIKTIKYGDSML